MKTFRAMAAGIAGALAMSLVMWLMRSNGIEVGLEMLLGSIAPPVFGLSTWTIGFLIHLAIGAMVAVAYAAAFELAVQRAGPLVGAGFGLAHGLMAGLFMSAIPAMNPLGPGSGSAPGPFLSHIELGPLYFLLLHCIYGAVVGTLYGRTVQKPHEFTAGHPI